MGASSEPRRIAILAYEGLQSLDLVGPMEVFHGAHRIIAARAGEASAGSAGRGYEVSIVSRHGRPVQSASGLQIVPHHDLRGVPEDLDTLIIPGGGGRRDAERDQALLDWITNTAQHARRTVSVCTGAFLLARAGLLEGKRVTTHWASAQQLAEQYPGVTVDPDPIYIREGPVWTSAGVTAGMDLALALVEEDHDREMALTIARHLVLFLRRPGSQSQFSAALVAQQPEREPLREIQRSVLEHPAAKHSVEAMAARAHMSPRHFARAFRAETGVTPARYVERVRLETARRLLEETSEPVYGVAAGAGFPSAETMRRVFLRGLGISPLEYRRRFRGGAAEAGPETGAARPKQTKPRRKNKREEMPHGHRDRAVRQTHGTRRNRAV